MRTLALAVFVGGVALAAQSPKTYTPSVPPRADEQTILNARVVAVDAAGSRLTVRGVDVRADGGRDETFTVAAPASASLAGLKPGAEVLLVLRGTSVVEVRPAAASTTAGAAATRTTAPKKPRPAVTPAAVSVPVTPAPVPVATPFRAPNPVPTPRPVSTPIPVGPPPAVGMPRPVVLPSEGPSPVTSPASTPSPVTSPTS
jgi:hypothetical protein